MNVMYFVFKFYTLWYIYSFTAEEFELFGEEGIFLTSVNEVSNSRRTYFHWLVVRLNSDGEEVQGGLISKITSPYYSLRRKP